MNGLYGYLNHAYAESLSEFGEPTELPDCGAWILRRPIPGTPKSDFMGCYPLFACRQWSRLGSDLESLKERAICFSAVTDPFGDYNEPLLQACFIDVVRPFKEHLVIDLDADFQAVLSKHHRRNLRKSLSRLTVEGCDSPALFLNQWCDLYSHLVQRHSISGIARFSRKAFSMQLRIPGLHAFRAQKGEDTVGMLLWFVQGDIAYYHLGAHSPEGYDAGSSFALFGKSIEHFATAGLRWISLGGGAGVGNRGGGLERFKEGWATGRKTAYFCGRILDRPSYEKLAKQAGTQSGEYFPAYRAGEFG